MLGVRVDLDTSAAFGKQTSMRASRSGKSVEIWQERQQWHWEDLKIPNSTHIRLDVDLIESVCGGSSLFGAQGLV